MVKVSQTHLMMHLFHFNISEFVDFVSNPPNSTLVVNCESYNVGSIKRGNKKERRGNKKERGEKKKSYCIA